MTDGWLRETTRLGYRKADGKKGKRHRKECGCVYSTSEVFTPFLLVAWSGEKNTFEIQCKFLKMQVSFLC